MTDMYCLTVLKAEVRNWVWATLPLQPLEENRPLLLAAPDLPGPMAASLPALSPSTHGLLPRAPLCLTCPSPFSHDTSLWI